MELRLKLTTLFNHIDGDENGAPEEKNGRSKSIRKKLKILSHYISNYGLITLKMIDNESVHGLLLVFSHAVFSLIQFDCNFEIIAIHHDDSLCGKLSNRRISSIRITDRFAVISFIEATLAFVSIENVFTKRRFKVAGGGGSETALKWINFDRYCTRHTKRNLEIFDNLVIFWWNTALLTKWTAPTGKSMATPPNLIVFDLSSSSIIATETIYGEIIKVSLLMSIVYKTNMVLRFL